MSADCVGTKDDVTVAIVERKLFGGTCVNTGCIPTKTLIRTAEVAAFPAAGNKEVGHGANAGLARRAGRLEFHGIAL